MGFEEKNGQYVGFDIDLSQAVSEKLGFKVQFQPIDWDMKETELQNGTIDAIWNGYSATDERRESSLYYSLHGKSAGSCLYINHKISNQCLIWQVKF